MAMRELKYCSFAIKYRFSFSCPRVTIFLHSKRVKLKKINHKPSGEWLKFKFNSQRVEKYRNPQATEGEFVSPISKHELYFKSRQQERHETF